MDIESLEINLLKSSEINDGDTILVKIDSQQKSDLTKENIKSLFDKIKGIVKKDISIYFFPKNLSIDIIKNHVKNIEDSKNELIKENEENENT